MILYVYNNGGVSMNKLKILILSLAAFSLVACSQRLPEEQDKMLNLVEKEKDNFIAKVKEQYGEEASIINIRTEEERLQDPILFGSTVYAGDRLLGNIKVSSEKEFKAVYIPEKDLIISNKNYEETVKSAKKDLSSSELNILDLQIRNSAREIHLLKDEIKTYKDIVNDGRFATIKIVTDSDISKLDFKSFNEVLLLMESYKEDPNILRIEILQVDDPKIALKLGDWWNRSGINLYEEIKYYDKLQGGKKEFKEYGVIASLNLSFQQDGQIEYVNTKGESFALENK